MNILQHGGEPGHEGGKVRDKIDGEVERKGGETEQSIGGEPV